MVEARTQELLAVVPDALAARRAQHGKESSVRARELIYNLSRMGPQDLRVLFLYLADAAIDAELAHGNHLRDISDFIAWLRELADAVKRQDVWAGTEATPPKVTVISQDFPEFCPDCGHVHIDDSECKFPIGGERICRCERKVSA
jgi:hypothetical protein